jgi:uncharacterized membrane protein
MQRQSIHLTASSSSFVISFFSDKVFLKRERKIMAHRKCYQLNGTYLFTLVMVSLDKKKAGEEGR